MLEFIALLSALIIVAVLSASFISLYLKYKKVLKDFVQAEIDKLILFEQVEKTSQEISAMKIQETDGFLKFISESRDWAFGYIENVQKAIEKLHKAMESNDEAKITEAYAELIKFLPSDNLDMVN